MNILLQSTVEPMVLTAGRLREAALFAYRRFLLESVAPGGTVDPALIAHGGTSGPWVLGPGVDLSAFRASHGPQMEALDELRRCEGVRRAIAAMPECEAFLAPLDADAAGVTNYFATISTPCDMRTVGQRIASAATHLLRQITGAETVDAAATEASDDAALAVEGDAATGASAVTADVKPMKPWRLVTSRWVTYDAEQCRDDLLLVSAAHKVRLCVLFRSRALPSLSRRFFSMPSASIHWVRPYTPPRRRAAFRPSPSFRRVNFQSSRWLVSRCCDHSLTSRCLQSAIIDRTMAVADPAPFGAASSTALTTKSTLAARPPPAAPVDSDGLPASAVDDRAVSTPADVAWFLAWPAKRAFSRNKYFRVMAQTVLPTFHRLQVRVAGKVRRMGR